MSLHNSERTELLLVIQLIKQHAERTMDTTLLSLAIKAEVLGEQQTVEVTKLCRKLTRLKQKLCEQQSTPLSRASKRAVTSETVDCYVAPSYLSVQSRTARNKTAKRPTELSNACELLQNMELTTQFSPRPNLAMQGNVEIKDCEEGSDVATTHTDSSGWSIPTDHVTISTYDREAESSYVPVLYPT